MRSIVGIVTCGPVNVASLYGRIPSAHEAMASQTSLFNTDMMECQFRIRLRLWAGKMCLRLSFLKAGLLSMAWIRFSCRIWTGLLQTL